MLPAPAAAPPLTPARARAAHAAHRRRQCFPHSAGPTALLPSLIVREDDAASVYGTQVHGYTGTRVQYERTLRLS
jgi:hypothetical protein